MKSAVVILILLCVACSEIPAPENSVAPNVDSPKIAGAIIVPTTGEVDTLRKSIRAYAEGMVSGKKVIITYHSPAVRDRLIWGGLVPFEQPWVTGAHMATSLEMPSDFIIDNKKIPAGRYALFTIPSRTEWTFILNRNWQQHLTDEYNASEDVLRMKFKPDSSDRKQERLMYTITASGSEGTLSFKWDRLRFEIPFRLQ